MAQLETKLINIGENVVDIAFLNHRQKDVLVVAMTTGIINLIEPDSGIILASTHLRSRPSRVACSTNSSSLIVGMEDGSVALLYCGTRDDGEQLLDLKHAWDVSSRAVKVVLIGKRLENSGSAFLAGPGSNKISRVSTRPSEEFAIKDEVQLKEDIISASLMEQETTTKLWILGKKRHRSGEPAFPNVVTELIVTSIGTTKETNRFGMAVACTAIQGSTSCSDNFFVANASDRSIAEWKADGTKAGLTLVRMFQTNHELAIEKLTLRGHFLFTIGADMKIGRLDVSPNAEEFNYSLITQHGYSAEFAMAAAINSTNNRLITVVKHSAKTTNLTPLGITKLDIPSPNDDHDFNRLQNVESIMTALEGAANWRLKSEEILDRALEAKAKQQKLLQDNEQEPEIAYKLPPEDYAFDQQEISDFRQEKTAETDKLRQSLEGEVNAYENRCADIKGRCWDSREVPLKTLSGFQTTSKVSTFDVLKRGTEDPLASRSEISNDTESEVNDIALLFGPVRNERLQEILDMNSRELLEQKDLDTVEKKCRQVAVLKKIIHDLQAYLNAEFAALLKDKHRRIAGFSRAKQRTKEIQEELLFLHQELPAQAAKFLTDGIELMENNFEEMPELIFQRFEMKKEETGKRTPEVGRKQVSPCPISVNSEEFGKAALMSMMNGVLEPKREELLRREIPVPQFVVTKPREEWDAYDEKAFEDYQKQVEALEMERTGYKNELLEEVDKMEAAVAESKQEFDSQLESLASLKVDVATLVARAKLALARLNAEVDEIERLEEAGLELEGEIRDFQHAVRDNKSELRSLDTMVNSCARFRTTWTERGTAVDREATELIARHSSSPKAQESTWCAFRSHPTTFSSAVASIVAMYEDLREPCKPVNLNELEILSEELNEMDKAKPTTLAADGWQKLAELRRQRINCDLNQKLADNLLIKCQAKMQTTAAGLKAAELALEEKKYSLKLLNEQLEKFRTSPNVQVVLPWTQVEVDQYDFASGFEPNQFTVLPEPELTGLDKEIRAMADKSAENFRLLTKMKEKLEKAQWEEQEYVSMCEDIFRELHRIEKFKLDRAAQDFLRNGLEASRSPTAGQLETEFVEKRLTELENRCGKLQAQIREKLEENELLDRKVSELENSLAHPLSGIDLTSMFTERLEPIWREKQLKELIGLQKERITVLERELESLNMRTYPTLLNGPTT